MSSSIVGKGKVSAKAPAMNRGALAKANKAAYPVKGGSDKGHSHGSRPSHINSPESK